MESYGRKTGIWNEIYSEYQAVDLRNTDMRWNRALITVAGIRRKTSYVLDFGCGTGDIIFQYIQNFPGKKGVGIDEAERGIEFARKTANMSGYRGLHFFTGNQQYVGRLWGR